MIEESMSIHALNLLLYFSITVMMRHVLQEYSTLGRRIGDDLKGAVTAFVCQKAELLNCLTILCYSNLIYRKNAAIPLDGR